MHKPAKARLACIALSVVLALGSTPIAAWAVDGEGLGSGSAASGPVITPVSQDVGQADDAADPKDGDTASQDAASQEAVAKDAESDAEDTAKDAASQEADADSAQQQEGAGFEGASDASTPSEPGDEAANAQDAATDQDAAGASAAGKDEADGTPVSDAAKANPEIGKEEDAAKADKAVTEGDDSDEGAAAAAPVLLSSPAVLRGVDVGGCVYLSATGSDDADGLTAGTAVKSFAKAQEILGAKGAQIRLLSTITISSNETWELTDGQMVIRDDSFTSGPLIHVNPGVTFTAKNIVIDGGFGTTNEGVTGSSKYQQSAAIIDANFGINQPSNGTAVINLDPGAVLQNNHVVANSVGGTSGTDGGAIYARNNGDDTVQIFMKGATIDNCSTVGAGGAIAIEDGVKCAIRNGSTISNCSSRVAGGAVSVVSGETADSLSTLVQQDSTISNCSTDGAGGAVFAGLSYYYLYDGSVIESCTAANQGGGICLYNGAAGIISGAVDNPIYIRNNTSNAKSPDDNGNGEFGGGGIYVDTTSVNGGYRVSQLLMDTAVIRDNYAAIDGGGVAYCPQGGHTNTFYEDSAAIYGNSTESGHSDDFAIVRKGSVTADGYEWKISNIVAKDDPNVSPTALGGVAYRWVGPDGTEYDLSDLTGVSDFFGKSSIQKGTVADSLATIFIEGNSSASFGGGIACNGRMFDYTREPATVSLAIDKKWNIGEGAELPEVARMWIYRSDGEKMGFVDVKPGEDGTWSASVEGLPKFDPDGNPYSYTVAEEEIPANGGTWSPSVETTVDDEGNTLASVTNTMVVRVDVSKVWQGQVAGPVTITLLANGKPLDGAVLELSEANGWTSAFANLPKYDADGKLIVYTIAEVAMDGYTSTISGSATQGFTVTNKEDEEPESPEPEKTEPESPEPETPEPEKPEPEGPKSDQPEDAKPQKPEQVSYEGSVVPATGDDAPVAAGIAFAGCALACAFFARKRLQ